MSRYQWLIKTAFLSFSMAAGPFISATTITVNSTLDQVDADTSDGVCETAAHTCTLRAAVMQADVLTSPSVIIELPPGVYTLTRPPDGSGSSSGGVLQLTTPTSSSTSISIDGSDAATTIVDGGKLDQVFAVLMSRSVSVSNLTLRNGFTDANAGGGIGNEGSLTLDHVVVSDNAAAFGGGIFNSGTLVMTNSTVERNVADEKGGGLYSNGELSITASTIASNSAVAGGGLLINGNTVIVNSTIANNSASESGGGVNYDQGFASDAMNMYNSTVVDNLADSDQTNDGSGGGIAVSAAGVFNLYNSIVAGNYHINPAFADDCNGPVKTHAYNRFGNTSECAITQVSGAYALLNSLDDLSPLQDNGGPTQTVALLAGSNAIDGAAPTCLDPFSQPIMTDQRGFPRNVGKCDIGAYEYGAADPNDVIFKDEFE